ncbi:MAG: ATP-dependent sacrificial sulfur transferase LarE [Pseudobutyrivibrio sp.]|nr:ATP-dependent sacrificial sulfur transferase LarE [Pseudobutyrivibrio sp.]
MAELRQDLLEKYNSLLDYFKDLKNVAVAYSSGVDSTFLVYAMHEALGDEGMAVTVSAGMVPGREIEEAKKYCKGLGVRHKIIEVDEGAISHFAENPTDRCYHCKKALFTEIIKQAKENGIFNVAEGSNLDDLGDYRPGLKAISELEVKSPLRELGFTKQDIRDISAYLGLSTAAKPSFACLASRIPYGEEITREKLLMVDKAEVMLLDKGFKQFRVRAHGNVARIELLPEDFARMMDQALRDEIYNKFIEFGFSYVAMDLKGYRTGSLNETIGDIK